MSSPIAGGIPRRRFALGLGLTCLLASVAFSAHAPPAAAADISAAVSLPSPREGAAAIHIGDGTIYVFGGRAGNKMIDEVVRYRADEQEGRRLAARIPRSGDTEPGRAYAAAAYDGDLVYLFGGYSLRRVVVGGEESLTGVTLSDILAFDPRDENFTAIGVSMPESRLGASAQVLDRHIYVAGGMTITSSPMASSVRSSILEFDPTTRTLRQLQAKLPHPLAHAGSAVAADRIWLLGGNAGGGELSAGILSFDATIASGGQVRSAEASLPEPISIGSAASHAGRIFFIGGRDQLGEPQSGIYAFDVDKGTVTQFPVELPLALYGSASTAYDGSLFVFGGHSKSGLTHSEVFELRTNATVPRAPRQFEAVSARTGPDGAPAIMLSWSPPDYDGGAPVEGYRLLRRGESGNQSVTEHSGVVVSWRDDDVVPAAEYRYVLTSFNAAGEGPPVETAVLVGAYPPDTPRILRAFAGDGKATLWWAATPLVDASTPPAYQIRRVAADGRSWEISVSGSGGSKPVESWTDRNVVNGARYRYTIAATNTVGESPESPAVEVVPAWLPHEPIQLSTTPDNKSLRIAWSASISGSATGYNIYRATSVDNFSRINPEAVEETMFVDSNARIGTPYYYSVAAISSTAEGPWSLPVVGKLLTPPSAPKNLTARSDADSVVLSWAAPEDLGGGGIEAIRFSVSRDSEVLATNLPSMEFRDEEVASGRSYNYSVLPTNGLPGRSSTISILVPEREAPNFSISVLGIPPFHVGSRIMLGAHLGFSQGADIESWFFDFGDQSAAIKSRSPNIEHTYREPGTYLVNVWAVGEDGTRSAVPASLVVNVTRAPSMPGPTSADPSQSAPSSGLSSPPGQSTPTAVPSVGMPIALVALCVATAAWGGRSRPGIKHRQRSDSQEHG